jgi:hypothetical protein
VTVSFRTADGTATTGDGDYVGKTVTLNFTPGESTKTITIDVKGDSKTETDETFYLDLFGNFGNALFTESRTAPCNRASPGRQRRAPPRPHQGMHRLPAAEGRLASARS